MYANSSKEDAQEKKQVSPLALIAAAVALLAFLDWWGYRSFTPAPLPQTSQEEEFDAWVTQIAKESGGDTSKLSKEDLDKLNQMTGGFGAYELKRHLK